MEAFASLIDSLASAAVAADKRRHLCAYFSTVTDPERGWAVAILVGAVRGNPVRAAALSPLLAGRIDPVLLDLSLAHVGDAVETLALLWPERPGRNSEPAPLVEIISDWQQNSRPQVLESIPSWLDGLSVEARRTVLSLITGGLRDIAAPALVRQALADWGRGNGVAVASGEVDHLWHAQAPPYLPLFAWLAGAGPRPECAAFGGFQPLTPIRDLPNDAGPVLPPGPWWGEVWPEGLRILVILHAGGKVQLFTETADDVTAAFPDIANDLRRHAEGGDVVMEGLITLDRAKGADGSAALSDRVRRGKPSARQLAAAPAHLHVHDLLQEGADDLRSLPFEQRRDRLRHWMAGRTSSRLDLLPTLTLHGETLRGDHVPTGQRLVLKHGLAPYAPDDANLGWLSWRPPPLQALCVLMYVEQSQGAGAAAPMRLTAGVWAEGGQLVPVGKVDATLAPDEQTRLARWVREHAGQRFGPVREVSPVLTVAITYAAVHKSTRHKAGLTLREPQLAHIAWDHGAGEATTLDRLRNQILA